LRNVLGPKDAQGKKNGNAVSTTQPYEVMSPKERLAEEKKKDRAWRCSCISKKRIEEAAGRRWSGNAIKGPLEHTAPRERKAPGREGTNKGENKIDHAGDKWEKIVELPLGEKQGSNGCTEPKKENGKEENHRRQIRTIARKEATIRNQVGEALGMRGGTCKHI